MSHAIIIPIYCENRNTINLCNELQNFGAEHIVVVNDGLNPKSEYFNELTSIGCHLVHLKNNNGKGASLKAGIKYAHDNLYNITGYITCDADGQHTANDVMKISRMLDLRNGSLILGKRDYKKSKMPINIRIGNRLSSAYFKVITGKSCKDTQTGLRGIPAFLYDTVMKTKGSRFDFEMNFLTKCADMRVLFYFVNIIADCSNCSSNFRLIKDTYLIYRTPLRFATASIGCTIIDLVLFTIFAYILPSHMFFNIMLATLMARVVSGGINFLINRKVIFGNTDNGAKQALRFFILFFCIMCASSLIVSALWFYRFPLHSQRQLSIFCCGRSITKCREYGFSRTATELKELPKVKENKTNENGDTKMSPLFLYNFQLLSIFTKPLPFIAPAVVTIIKALGSTFLIPDVIL